MFDNEKIQTIRDLVRTAGQVYKDAPFLRTMMNGRITDISFSEFHNTCDTVAAWVADWTGKLGHQIRVAMLGENSCRYVSLLIGTMYGGGISIPIDPQISEKVLCACLKKAEVDIIIHDATISVSPGIIMEKSCNVRMIMTMDQWEAGLGSYAPEEEMIPVCAQDCAAIIFTSGTTGEEKGVMLSNRNLTNSVLSIDYETSYVKVNTLPLHHVFGLNSDIIRNFGSASVTCINGDVSKLNENMQIFQPTLIYVVPGVAQALYNKIQLLSQKTNRPTRELISEVYGGRIKKIVAGGAHLPAELVEKYQAMGIFLCQGYGMTESSPTIAFPDLNRLDKAHTAGRVVHRCRTRTVAGELQVKSPSVMMGYVNAPELTEKVITPDGWLRTGDIGYEDPEGFVHITGRLKNLIILFNGENVSPEQLENLLLDHRLVEECLVYGEDNCIVAEIFPNSQYANLNGITDVPSAIKGIVQEVNSQLPSFKKIMKHRIRLSPLQKTGTNKIIRTQRGGKAELLCVESTEYRKPENAIQQCLFNGIREILAHDNFGIDTDIFSAGMDSLGCMSLLSYLWEKLNLHTNLDELMAAPTVQNLEQLYYEKKANIKMDYSPRKEYPLSYVQKYFAYSVRDNTTGNVPVLFKLDSRVDLIRLQSAIYQLFRVHPILNNRIYATKHGLANSRDDSRPVHIPITGFSKEKWEEVRDGLIRPFQYGVDDPLYHIELYLVENSKYLLFDVAHIISDGVSLAIMLENLNRLYAGEPVQVEKVSFYEYILDELYREEKGKSEQDVSYFANLMEGLRIDRSILTCKGSWIRKEEQGAVLYGELVCAEPNRIAEFSQKVGVSENVFFQTAFNYCISLYSDLQDTVSTSIHNGRTDNRWSRVAGCLFNTYNFRCKFEAQKSIQQQLKENAKQIMETMRCSVNCMHANEMFFQYQGDLLRFGQIAGYPAEQLPVRLESLPFHLIVSKADFRYHYELRYWKNRFDTIQLRRFVHIFDSVLRAMLSEKSFEDVYISLPRQFFPDEKDWTVVNRNGKKQLFDAWGDLYEKGHPTGRVARILSDGSVDYLENSGRTVMQEGIMKRSFLELNRLEQIIKEKPGVREAHAYTYIGSRNAVLLAAEVYTDGSVSQADLMKFLKEKKVRNLLPAKLTIEVE